MEDARLLDVMMAVWVAHGVDALDMPMSKGLQASKDFQRMWFGVKS